MIAYNVTQNRVVAEDLKIAKNVWERFRGLLGSSELKEGEGFLIPSCKGIHTFGMTYPIDVLYLDQESRVLALLENYRPNLAGPVIWSTQSVLELPKGTIERSNTRLGDFLLLENGPSNFLMKPIPIERPILNSFSYVPLLNSFGCV